MRFVAVLSTLVFFTHFSSAQVPFYGATLNDQGVFMGGMGLATIGGETFYTINLRPELAVGKFGFGLDIPLRYNTQTGRIRSEDWDESYDYFRAIRFVRYGRKYDKFYTRIGTLESTRLGHGFIMNYYNNALIYDERKTGMELNVDFTVGGFEVMTSNFGRAEIFGGRVYFRPLQLATETPIIKNFALGATFVTDIDPDEYRGTDDSISEFGIDAELPIVSHELTRLVLYGDLAKIKDFGTGQAAGIELTLRGISGVFDFGAQLERRFLGEQFLPAYFGPFYELERHSIQNDKPFPKRDSVLAGQDKKTRGTFGMLYGQVLNTFRLLGTYERRDGIPKSGVLHIEATAPDAVPKIAFRAMYDDKNIDTFNDVFTIKEGDFNTSARVGLGYKIHPALIFYMDYIYTFERKPNGDLDVQKRFEPQLALAVTFPVGGGR